MSVARILLIEDEATSREILDLVLSGTGYTVDVADTAAAAHKQLSSTRYALVIADWLLPDGDGIYIADRAVGLGSRTLIITGHVSDLPAGPAKSPPLPMKPTKPDQPLGGARPLLGETPTNFGGPP